MSETIKARSIRVLIVDDHPMVRDGTKALLDQEKDIDVVGVAGDGASGFRMIGELQPDVLVLDVRLPDMSGIEVARRVHETFPKVAILIMTGYDDVGYLRALVEAGAKGYLRKTASGENILSTVRALAEGRMVMESGLPWDGLQLGPEPLTAREQEVLRLLVAGGRNTEIAEKLGLATKTVEFHISNLLEKLGARSRTEAMIKARQLGLTSNKDSGSNV